MADVSLARAPHRRAALIGAGAAGLVVVLLLGAIFSSSYGTQRAAAHGAALGNTQAALGALSVARAAVGQALLFARDQQAGLASAGSVDLALDRARVAVDDLEVRLGDVRAALRTTGGDGVDPYPFVDAAHDVIESIAAGDVDRAELLVTSALSDGFGVLSAGLVATRDRESAAIADLAGVYGQSGDIAGIVLALAMPGAILLAYRSLARRRAEHFELESRLEHERALNKAKDDFVANVSHELRTPLTAVAGFTDVILASHDLSAETRELLDIVAAESGDLGRMVEDLLVVSRADAGVLTFQTDEVLVTDVLDAVTRAPHRAGSHLTVACPAAIVRADRLRLRQVLRNLVSNAERYGGPRVRITGQVRNGRLWLRVSDNGPGVDPAVESRLFERFAHGAHKVVGSVGLGLSICRTLLEGMNGTIRHLREDGQTHFEISLPLASGPARAPTPRRVTAPVADPVTERP